MIIFQIFLLALVQGITEFLPVSSSGHILLLSKLTDLNDVSLPITIALHLGSLIAVLFFYKKDIFEIFKNKSYTKIDSLPWKLAFATLPIIIVGSIFFILKPDFLKTKNIIGLAFIIFGYLLYYYDKKPAGKKTIKKLTFKDAFNIGLFQTCALIPGTSRSGITITGSRKIGLTKQDSIKFALLLAIPTLTLASIAMIFDLAECGNPQTITYAIYATLLSFIVSFITLYFFVNWSKKGSMFWFAVYRIILGTVILLI